MMHCRFLEITCLLCLLAHCYGWQIQSTDQSTGKPDVDGPLIDVPSLAAQLQDPNLVLLDLGPEKDIYDENHLPGAIYVDWVEDITDLSQPERYKLVDQPTMEKLLGRLGVTRDSRIVIYDDMNSRVATRLYWSLKYYGLPLVQVLNGGRPAWVNSKQPMTSEVPDIKATKFRITRINEKMAANLEFVADRLQDPNVSLVDGRPAKQFTGEEPGKVFHTGALHEKRGHIPGAINIFWKDNFNADGTFKSIPELEKLYESVTGSDMVVTYCNEGLHAVPPWFVLSELLGHGDVRVYDDSLSEWANSDQPTELSSEKKNRK